MRYPNTLLPPFPPKIFIGRSHIQKVSKERMENLNVYLKGILQHQGMRESLDLLDFLRADEDDLANHWFNKRLSDASANFAGKYH